jgi:hypothetical protein
MGAIEKPEDTYKNLSEAEREAAVINEFVPFLILAAIPIIITIIIAKVFGPTTF